MANVVGIICGSVLKFQDNLQNAIYKTVSDKNIHNGIYFKTGIF